MSEVTAERRQLIADALGRSPTEIVELDVGYDFEVAIVDHEWVFRFPRRSGVEQALEVEIALLLAIAPALPVEVPSFEHVSRVPLFVGYRLISGTPLVDEDADGVRSFLEALHALDPSVLPVDRPDWVEAYRDQCAEFERLVFPVLDQDTRAKAARLFSDVETLVDFEPALVHADLGPEHLLVRDGRLVGVIDWGDVRVGDPALDYSWLLSGPFADWEVDPDLRRRARFYHRLAPWFEAHYGLFTNQPSHTERGVDEIGKRLLSPMSSAAPASPTGMTSAEDTRLAGRCRCGAVRYEVLDAFRYAANCHCSECRAATGSAFKAFAGIEREKLTITDGLEDLAVFGDDDLNDTRCKACGCFLFSVVRDGAFVHVALGSLVDAPTIRPTHHIFVGSKAPWFEITDDLPQFDEHASY